MDHIFDNNINTETHNENANSLNQYIWIFKIRNVNKEELK